MDQPVQTDDRNMGCVVVLLLLILVTLWCQKPVAVVWDNDRVIRATTK